VNALHLERLVTSVELKIISNEFVASDKADPVMQRWKVTPQEAVNRVKMNLQILKILTPRMRRLLDNPTTILQEQRVFAEAIPTDVQDKLGP